MKARHFRPGLAAAPRFARSGSSFEPAHGQKVEILYPEPGTDWEPAVYNREKREFWMKVGGEWIKADFDVAFFRQLPPAPGRPFAGSPR